MSKIVQTILIPISGVPKGDYCFDGKFACQHFDNSYAQDGECTCGVGDPKHDKELGKVLKPTECQNAKVIDETEIETYF